MQETPDPRRHPRTVMATDTEWRRVRERADAAGMPISRFICQRAAGPERPPPPGLALEAVLAYRSGLILKGRNSMPNNSPDAYTDPEESRNDAEERRYCIRHE